MASSNLLHLAVKANDLTGATDLLDGDYPFTVDDSGRYPWSYIKTSKPTVTAFVTLFIENYVGFDLKNEYNIKWFQKLCFSGYLQSVHELLDYLVIENGIEDIDALSPAFLDAVEDVNWPLVFRFIGFLDPCVIPAGASCSCIEEAARADEIELLKFFIKKTNHGLSYCDIDGNNLLHICVIYMSIECFEHLASLKQLSFDAKNNNGETVLDLLSGPDMEAEDEVDVEKFKNIVIEWSK